MDKNNNIVVFEYSSTDLKKLIQSHFGDQQESLVDNLITKCLELVRLKVRRVVIQVGNKASIEKPNFTCKISLESNILQKGGQKNTEFDFVYPNKDLDEFNKEYIPLLRDRVNKAIDFLERKHEGLTDYK